MSRSRGDPELILTLTNGQFQKPKVKNYTVVNNEWHEISRVGSNIMPTIHNTSALSEEALRQINESPAARFAAKLNGASPEKPFFFADIFVANNFLDNTILPIIHVKRTESESEPE